MSRTRETSNFPKVGSVSALLDPSTTSTLYSAINTTTFRASSTAPKGVDAFARVKNPVILHDRVKYSEH